VTNEALDKHNKDVEDFMKSMERRWPNATPKERIQMRRDFIALMQQAGPIAPLMNGDDLDTPN
jgi:hypothetical protein